MFLTTSIIIVVEVFLGLYDDVESTNQYRIAVSSIHHPTLITLSTDD